MQRILDLRRKPRTQRLAGVLVLVVGSLMLYGAGRRAGEIVFALIFLLGGLALLCYLDRAIVDLARGELTHQRGFLLPLRTRRYPLRMIRAIGLLVRVTGKGDGRRARFVVRLVGIRDSVLSSSASPWHARLLAERLARWLQVPLHNRVYGVSSRRDVADLDLPLVGCWARDGKRFPEPALPAPTLLRERRDATSYTLSMPAQLPKLGIPAIVLLSLALLFFAAAARGAPIGTGIAMSLGLFALVGGSMALAFAGRSRLSIVSGRLSFRQGCFPLKSRIAIAAIEELVVAADGITLIGDTEAVWIHWAGSREDSAYLEAVVPSELARLGRSYQSTGATTP